MFIGAVTPEAQVRERASEKEQPVKGGLRIRSLLSLLNMLHPGTVKLGPYPPAPVPLGLRFALGAFPACGLSELLHGEGSHTGSRRDASDWRWPG